MKRVAVSLGMALGIFGGVNYEMGSMGVDNPSVLSLMLMFAGVLTVVYVSCSEVDSEAWEDTKIGGTDEDSDSIRTYNESKRYLVGEIGESLGDYFERAMRRDGATSKDHPR